MKAHEQITQERDRAMTGDPWRAADHFPLGRIAGLCDAGNEEPSSQDTRPFGLRYAIDANPGSRGELDFAALDYDVNRQIAIMRDGGLVLPAFKHTSGQTTTETASHDRNAGDTDSDVESD